MYKKIGLQNMYSITIQSAMSELWRMMTRGLRQATRRGTAGVSPLDETRGLDVPRNLCHSITTIKDICHSLDRSGNIYEDVVKFDSSGKMHILWSNEYHSID